MKIKGALHIHSTYSYDGKSSLKEIKDQFQKAGLSFACITEHADFFERSNLSEFLNNLKELSDDKFIFVPGFEVAYGKCHVLMIGGEEFVSQKAEGKEDLENWKKASKIVILAHPHRNDFIVDSALKGVLDGIEIWNSQYDGKYAPRSKSIKLFKKLKRENLSLIPSAGLDFHNSAHIGGPVIEIETSHLSKEEIISKIKMGDLRIVGKIGTINSSLKIGFLKRIFLSVVSSISIFVVSFGKWVNKALKRLGFSLPKNLIKAIRKGI